ncbi:MAG: hypothetical protein AAGF12_00475 [Myxococcota bacterium]
MKLVHVLVLGGLFSTLLGCGSTSAGNDPSEVAPATTVSMAQRTLVFNQQPLGQADADAVARIDQTRGAPLPDGNYWYDNESGALGPWGGPAQEFVPAQLNIGGPMVPNASTGGTAVFVNGREIHPEELITLQNVVGREVPQGRYWMDFQGNAGPEGGASLINLFVALHQTGSPPPGTPPIGGYPPGR